MKVSNPRELILNVRVGSTSQQGWHLPSLLHLFPPQHQELLEYMRKLEARLEKVADEKWNEDAATEDEEAAAGLSLYTPNLVTPLPCSTFPCWGKLHVTPLGAASAFCVLPFPFPHSGPCLI